jgi:Zn-dependent protease with chaperone function
MHESPSLAGRTALAIVVMVGFYLLALGIAGGLAWLIYQDLTHSRYVHGRLVLFGGITIAIIVWSILPRRDKFPDPGVRLHRDDQPELFAAIEKTAQAAQQRPPAEVFLVGDVNAFVAERGGIAGFGSRRVMGIGLPLLQTLNVSELRSVLAHEFGHFHGGDTKLGPWIYKTRGAIDRTIRGFAKADSLLCWPFRWYGNLFLRITHAISRRQELAADALAVRIAGLGPVQEALRKVNVAAPMFHAYLEHDYQPLLSRGVRAPLAAGFEAFLSTEGTRAMRQEVSAAAMHERSDPYDTHPPLRERLAAAERVGAAGQAKVDARPAIRLLRRLDELEADLIAFQTGNVELGRTPPTAWNETGATVFAEQWRNARDQHRALIPAIALGDLPSQRDQLRDLGKRMDASLPDEHLEPAGAWLLAASCGHVLVRAGFAVLNRPGERLRLQRDAHTIEPFDLFRRVAERPEAAGEWRAQCESAGVAALRLDA